MKKLFLLFTLLFSLSTYGQFGKGGTEIPNSLFADNTNVLVMFMPYNRIMEVSYDFYIPAGTTITKIDPYGYTAPDEAFLAKASELFQEKLNSIGIKTAGFVVYDLQKPSVIPFEEMTDKKVTAYFMVMMTDVNAAVEK